MLVIEDLGDYLQSKGMGTQAVDMFLGIQREEPSNQILITPTGGYELTSQRNDIKPTFQILVRNVSYSEGYTKINAIYALFRNEKGVISPNGRKMLIKPMQPPFSLGEDDNKRAMFAFNISIVTTL